MKRIVMVVVIALIVSTLMSVAGWAQSTATVSGSVKDMTGAVLPGVEVKVTQTETSVARTTVTNETGSYVLPNLPLGPYRLEASLPGFRTFVQTGITLQVGSSPTLDVVLQVGQVSEQVEVEANAALVETRTSSIGQVVENERILELPLNGRAVVELVSLAGAATPAATLDGNGGRSPFSKGNVSIAGGMHTGVRYTLDGAYHQDPYTNGYMSLPFPDALQEFKVESGATGAQTGGKSSGSVSLVTKSGTNEFHGDAFEFVRNGKFNARNAFATKRDSIKRNQFGGTIGGPIAKNKLFFFGGFQGSTIRQDPSDTLGFVPTAAMKAGDFTDFASAACNAGRAMTLRAPFVNNRLDPALFSPAAVKLANKLPTATDSCGRIVYGAPSIENSQQLVSRIDYSVSDKHTIFGRYLFDNLTHPSPFNVTHLNMNALEPSISGRGHAVSVGSTYLFSANIVNAARLTGNRLRAGKTPADNASAGLGPEDIGVKASVFVPHSPTYTITGFLGPAGLAPDGSNSTGLTTNAIFSANDDLSILKGNHQFAIGGQWSYWQSNSYSTSGTGPALTFTGQTTGLGAADFFAGLAARIEGGTGSEQQKAGKALGLYYGDTWKVTPRWTLNYGLRWEPFFALMNKDKSAVQFDEAFITQGIKTQRFTDSSVPVGFQLYGDPNFIGGSGSTSGMNTQWWNFSPRFGFAWDINGDGKTSLRASAGTFYDYPSTFLIQGLTTAGPFAPTIRVNNVNFDNPWATTPGGDPFPRAAGPHVDPKTPWPNFNNIVDIDPDTANVQVHQWNLSLQRQVGKDWLVSASYLGSNTIHLWTIQQINLPVFLGLGPCTINGVSYNPCSTTANADQRRRLNLAYGSTPSVKDKYANIGKIYNGGTANYNGMLLSVQRQAARGVTISANYTWSHCISDLWTESLSDARRGQGLTDPNNRAYDRGNCSVTGDDRRHLFNVSSVLETPQFSNSSARMIASGWRIAPLVRILSGNFMTITTAQDRTLNGSGNQRVDQVLGNPYGDKSVSNYLNSAAFALPTLGTFGSVGRANILGTGTWQFDMALSRTFQLKERQKIEFRAEAFNVTNSFHPNNPTSDFDSNTFGQVTTAKDPRIMQFALKYIF
jgi:Carboxypeptidase regulatory-like domain/TonB dependent receptor